MQLARLQTVQPLCAALGAAWAREQDKTLGPHAGVFGFHRALLGLSIYQIQSHRRLSATVY